MPATQLSSISSTLLPPEITGPIFTKATEQSAVMRLARQVPLSVTAETAIPVPLDVPMAGWLVEGGAKPVSGSGVGVKTMAGKKVAVLVPVSEEVAMTDAASLYTQLENDLPTAIARAFDYAAIHGRGINGGPGPFSDSLIETTNVVTLGTTAAADGGMYADIVGGEALVESNDWDFSGFAADPRIRTMLKLSTDTIGHPLFTPNVLTGDGGIGDGATGSGTLDGFPIAFNRGVSGKLYRQSNINQRTVLDGQTTDDSLNLISDSADFDTGDIGKTVSGTGIPANTTIVSITSDTEVVMSAEATATATGVSVLIAGAADTGLRAIGGDWSQCAYGVGIDLRIKVSNEASYVDSDGTLHNVFQENLVLLLAEAYYGFVVGPDPLAFVQYLL